MDNGADTYTGVKFRAGESSDSGTKTSKFNWIVEKLL